MYAKSLLPAFLIVVCGASVAHAESQVHDGFLLRLSLGFGFESLSIDNGAGTTTDLDGFGIGASVGIGGVVLPNLAINADFFGATVVYLSESDVYRNLQ